MAKRENILLLGTILDSKIQTNTKVGMQKLINYLLN